MIALTAEQKRSIEQRFHDLAGQWAALTAYRSNTNSLRDNPVRRELIALGDPAVPLILAELQRQAAVSWFGILAEITRANPVSEGIAGQVQATALAWIDWGREQGYVV